MPFRQDAYSFQEHKSRAHATAVTAAGVWFIHSAVFQSFWVADMQTQKIEGLELRNYDGPSSTLDQYVGQRQTYKLYRRARPNQDEWKFEKMLNPKH